MELVAIALIALTGWISWKGGKEQGVRDAHAAERQRRFEHEREIEETFSRGKGETAPFDFPYINYGTYSDTAPRVALVSISTLLRIATDKELGWHDEEDHSDELDTEIWNAKLNVWADKNYTLAGETKERVIRSLRAES